jgi:hypothetical protein
MRDESMSTDDYENVRDTLAELAGSANPDGLMTILMEFPPEAQAALVRLWGWTFEGSTSKANLLVPRYAPPLPARSA